MKIREITLRLDNTDNEDYKYLIHPGDNHCLTADEQATRGYWSDPTPFVLKTFYIGHMTYRPHFADDQVIMDSPEKRFCAEGNEEKCGSTPHSRNMIDQKGWQKI